ncbi:5-formyltetrahydrofolate cyclo-ligase [Gluconacetobacter sacchari]|uniref:5-formyltetrahydrofolate cyclo-ligase n=2 Tax=Gluconacetobacter sacchari TaxID=92759 RepID=A0A7W4NJ82_9PROT|nr:5-formyltetrahydrofolate cyclo-ligase [Gluconacetobacter sacchari]MBB2158772.1 5-formyltetrahydrofolate cyclo-ligase [Gluconacetobacter sacchari]GBQ21974.1 5-formyltetrahydrofolate cyclo-ligase [Gluconacetobacter sacchari DSM 12717]
MAAPHNPPPSDPPALVAAKADLRERLRALRAAPPSPAAIAALCRRMAAHVRAVLPPGADVAAVWPLPGEVDLRGLCAGLHEGGYGVLLPETPPRGLPLCFRRWRPDAEMRPGRFGTLYPDGAMARPDLVFVPLLGFDRRGFRLGYGGGYYDRTLAELPGVPAVGYGLSAQEVPAVPVGVYDVPLPVILTERDVILV